VHLFAPRILKLLTFLSRRQEWLSPNEIARIFQIDGRPVSVRTLYRWFSFLEEKASLAYFPYPRMNLLGLANFHVRIQGASNPAVLSSLPWGHSYWVEINLDGRPSVSQGYWIPSDELRSFYDYWRTAKDLDLVQQVDVFPLQNPNFIFSPFDESISKNGYVEIHEDLNNDYFVPLLRRHLREKYEIGVDDLIQDSPLVVPLVLEHLWRHCSSRHIWQAIQAKGDAHIRKYANPALRKIMKKKGAALQVINDQWTGLLQNFDDVFLQPVVFWPLGLLRNCVLVNSMIRVGSNDRLAEMALKISSRSVVTSLTPSAQPDTASRIWCNHPSNQMPAILRLIREYHEDDSHLHIGIVDLHATRQTSRSAFCGFDWHRFDPSNLSWQYEGESHIERLKASIKEGKKKTL
jgi:hypothetical protein